ncbi:sulfatase-like hydrolase/transferase [Campylobacter geochelonis]|uniref:sulfatase-like hydrolase/transferase n=1 Tax=Campylobacter geochelonis TaxID=1780362 RepID=UPI000770A20D|nr:sulfatase-like hydrolase/transferase [Campylobacter geochelonis]CZE45967.1 putative phosphoglycerol transferase I (phosphatidylglycerol--membrane-oligosaccharide glycerophosphotransferase) [Campylobacter geochelonis]
MISALFFLISLLFLYFCYGKNIKIFGLVLVFFYLITALFSYSFYFAYGKFLDLSLLQVILLSIKGAPLSIYYKEILLFLSCVVAILLFCLLIYQRSIKNKFKFKYFNYLFFATMFLAIAQNPLIYTISDIFKIENPIKVKLSKDRLHKYIVKPAPNKLNLDKNIVYIYLESFNANFTTDFADLTPNLNSIKNKIEFTNIKEPISRAAFTIQGIYASMCGTSYPVKEDKHKRPATDALCASEILKESGYYLSFMKGASLDFQGTRSFLEAKKFDKMSGKEEFAKRGVDKFNEWGVDDDVMLEFAFKEFMRLSQEKDKFLLSFITVGTHTPDGFISQKCSQIKYKDGKDKMLNAVKCTDFLIGEFIRKIQSSKFSKNTIIVVQNDHYMPLFSHTSNLEPKMYFVIIDDDIKKLRRVDFVGTTFDTFTTLFGYMGVLDKMNLGRNVLKNLSFDKDLKDSVKKDIYDTAATQSLDLYN